MKSMSRFKNTMHAIGVLIAVFALYKFAFAQDVSIEVGEGEIVTEQSSVVVEELETIETPEYIEPVAQEEPIVEPEEDSGDISLFDKIIDIFTPEDKSEPVEVLSDEEEMIETEMYEEEQFQDFVPYDPPKNLPSISAFPEIKTFEVDTQAQHMCWVSDFSVDMTFLPQKNNTIFIENDLPGPSQLEITGVPDGFSVYFKNGEQKISLASDQKEIPIIVEKEVGSGQNGNFNVTFIFTRTMGGESVATCQMNIINS